ncbi:MAG: bifunctional 5,10-methylenetetrahydrofolate dehydrogenase/5,10-methenyltetrahydrofolate cyclohydrolase [Candidatus Colwellbacteria bacterium]|nr:bifunctional 5,10-methylenetetrahydrofolate dehydrogenase/5,10-methenyltetrahydrofolate cyclohydrolase [Candidatus Colwellbacteria bacterium]
MKIDGHSIAREIVEDLKKLPKPKKIFAAILVGDDPRSISFLKQKEQVAKELEIDFRLYKLGAELGNDGLRQEIRKLVEKKIVGGAIVQLPLPEGINASYVLNVIPREKDVDVLGERTLGAFYNNRNPVLPPAVATVKTILEKVNLDLENKEVAVVGLGKLVGKPVSLWLTGKCKELHLLGKTSDLGILTTCDVVISGVGKASIIKPEMLKEGAGIIDFGYYYFPDGEVSGDLETNKLIANNLKLGFYTPTPGGTGPILVAELFRNFYTLAGSKN